jgi:hypothetical protein
MSKREATPGARDRQRSNSAKRLHDVLTVLKTIEGPNLFEVLPIAMKIKKGDELVDPSWAAIRSLKVVGEMVDDVQREILQSGLSIEERKFYIRCLPGICQAMSPLNFALPWPDACHSKQPHLGNSSGNVASLGVRDCII